MGEQQACLAAGNAIWASDFEAQRNSFVLCYVTGMTCPGGRRWRQGSSRMASFSLASCQGESRTTSQLLLRLSYHSPRLRVRLCCSELATADNCCEMHHGVRPAVIPIHTTS